MMHECHWPWRSRCDTGWGLRTAAGASENRPGSTRSAVPPAPFPAAFGAKQPMCDIQRGTFAGLLESVAEGRRCVADVLSAWGLDQVGAPGALDDLLVITSELLANAVRFSGGEVTVEIVGHRNGVRLVVSDDAPAPAVPRQVTAESTGGRGLPIIQALATRWDQRPYSAATGTKDVWAELCLPDAALPRLRCAHLA